MSINIDEDVKEEARAMVRESIDDYHKQCASGAYLIDRPYTFLQALERVMCERGNAPLSYRDWGLDE